MYINIFSNKLSRVLFLPAFNNETECLNKNNVLEAFKYTFNIHINIFCHSLNIVLFIYYI